MEFIYPHRHALILIEGVIGLRFFYETLLGGRTINRLDGVGRGEFFDGVR